MSGRYSSTPTEARSPSPPLDYLVDWHGDASPPKAPVLSTDMMELSAPWNKTWSTAPASEEKSEEWFAFQPEKPRSPTQAARNTRPDITTLEDRTPANPVPLRPENLLEKTIHIIPSAAQKVDKKSYLGLAAVTPATPPARVTAPAAQTQDTANMLTEGVVRPPVSAGNGQPPLWKSLTTRNEPGQVLENLGNGQWRVLLGEGETQRKMVFNDAQVAAMTGMFKPELEVFKAKNPPQKMAPAAEVPAATEPQNIPAVRADRPFGELDAEVARVAGKNRREYPRTAEQAIANFRADGQELTDREANMIYSKFSQEYPGLNKIPRVEPTPQVPLPESLNDPRPQMRAATPKEIDSWGLRKSLAQPTSPYGLGFGEPELPVTPPSQDNPPRLTWNNQYDRISNTSEQKLKVDGQWRVEDIPAFLKDPSLMHVTPAERQQLLNDVLRAAGEDYARRKGYSRENFVAYQTFADHLRKEVSGLTTAGDHTEGLVNGVGEVSTGILRGTIAKAADGTMLEPEFGSDPSIKNLRVPYGTVARQAGYWGQKGMDTVDTLWASGKGHDLEEGLSDLEKDLAEGNLPFGDRDAFEAWIKKHSQQISQGQSTWYEAVQGTAAKINQKDGKEQVMDGDWLQGYARSNSLEAPQNASLLAEFIRTRDPAVWAQLTDNLKKTPRRAGIERDQQAHLENSSVVRFLTNSMGTVDYKEAMKQAGNPLDLASDFIPIVRGARMVSSGAKAASGGGKVVAGIKSVAGSIASDLAIDSLNQAVENPNSTPEDYLATGRDTVATALGLHAVGMAAGKVGQMLPQETNPPLPNGAQPAPAPHPTPPETTRQPESSAQPAPLEPAPPSGQQSKPPGMNEGQIEAIPSEINPQVISEAPGAAPVAPPPSGPISVQEKLQQLHEQAASKGLAPEIHEVDGKFIVKDHEGSPATFENREDAVQAAFVFMTPEQRQSFLETIQPNQGNQPATAAEPALSGSPSPTPESVTPANDQSNQPVQELPPERSIDVFQPEDHGIEAAPREQTPEDRSQANPASQAAQYEEAAREGLVPPISEEDDKFIVTDHEGKEAFFTSRDDAVQAALDLRTPEQIQKMQERQKLKQKAKVKKTSLAKKQPVAVMANGDDWHGTEGDGELVDADGSVSTDEVSSSSSATIKNSQASESGSPPPTPEVPPLRQGSLDQDSRSIDKAMVISEAARQGIVPPIREEEGKFIVTDHEGNPATFDNREEAVQAAFIFMTPEQRQQVQAMVDGRQNQPQIKSQQKEHELIGVEADKPDAVYAQQGGGGSAAHENGSGNLESNVQTREDPKAETGSRPPNQPGETEPSPPLWQGSMGKDSHGNDHTVVIRRRKADGNYEADAPGGQSISFTPEAYEAMTGTKPDPLSSDANVTSPLQSDAVTAPLWHVPLESDHQTPKFAYDEKRKPVGQRKVSNDSNANNQRAASGENEAADVLAKYGYETEQVKEAKSSPDLRINGIPNKVDVYSPNSQKTLKGIWDFIDDKVGRQNAPYVVVYLEPNGQSIDALKKYISDHQVDGLKQLFVIKSGKLYIIK